MVDPIAVATHAPLQSSVAGGVPAGGEVFLLGRVLFGVVLAFMGLNHFLNLDDMAGYAASKGIPMPEAGVVVSGLLLVLGGLGIAAGLYPALAALALVAFFVVATPTMHDFWAAPEDQRQNEMINFLKNVALLGGSLAFYALSGSPWEYAVEMGLFW
jgi:uncharacterized membrane protein YphA (DoxX/SURF4 family)